MIRTLKWFCAFALVLLFAPGPVLAADGSVVLTMFGKIATANRAGRDDFNDPVFKLRDIRFDKALELSPGELANLPQAAISANAAGWPGPVRLEGPRLKDVLALAGAGGAAINVTAIDGYSIELSAEEQAGKNWVLALKSNGKLLGLGGRGPLWLAFDTGAKKASADEEAKWVYSIFAIEVK